jgi:hypothetical protein
VKLWAVQRRKANVKTGFFNQRIATLGLFMEPVNVDDFLLERGDVVRDPLISDTCIIKVAGCFMKKL